MKRKKIIEVHYNWFAMSDKDAFQRISIGDIYETTHGTFKCVEIREKLTPSYHVEMEFEDGSIESQWNINKLIYEGNGEDKT